MRNDVVKKGDSVVVVYRDTSGITTRACGVVFGITKNKIVLGHNFSNTTPLDTSTIERNTINTMQKIDVVDF